MRIGIPVYPEVDLLDVAGPHEMLSWAGFELVLAAETPGRIVCRGGVALQVDVAFVDAPKFEVLWTPGGSPEALAKQMSDPRRGYLDFLIQQSVDALRVFRLRRRPVAGRGRPARPVYRDHPLGLYPMSRGAFP